VGSAGVSVYILNPNSADSPEALAFMEFMITQMEPQLRTNFFPDEDELFFVDAYYDEEVMLYEQRIGVNRQKLLKAEEDGDETDKKMAQARIDELEQNFQLLCEEQKLLSAKSTAQFRAMRSQFIYVRSNVQFYGPDFYPLIMRFADGQMKSDQLLAELSQKVRMMELEGQ